MKDWVVVVTGASRGIGLATASALVERGARVVLVGREDAALRSAVAALGEQASGEGADLTIAGAATALIERVIEQYGRIDLLINNAGRSADATPAWELSPSELAATFAVNVHATWEATRALIGWAIPRGETTRIVNVSSGVVAQTPAHAVDYVASKHAVEGLTRAIARDVYGSGVTITSVQLGAHQTELSRGRFSPDAFAELPPAADAAATIVRAAMAPSADVHGRILTDDQTQLTSARVRRGTIDRQKPRAHVLPLGPSPRVRHALAAMTDEELARLPDEGEALREALAVEWDLPMASVAIGAGISELLERVLGLFVRPGEAVLANAPSWPLFPQLCAELGIGWQRVPYRLGGRVIEHDLASFASRVTSLTRLAYVVSPGNPSARAAPLDELASLLAALPPHVPVVVDEAYGEFTTTPSARALLSRYPDRVIVLRTFSKFFGLAALRIGYALAAPSLATAIARAGTPFVVNRAAQVAATAGLTDRDHRRATAAFHRDERARVEARLDAMGIVRLRSDAPFLLVAQPDAPLFGGYASFPIGTVVENDQRLALIAEAHGIRS